MNLQLFFFKFICRRCFYPFAKMCAFLQNSIISADLQHPPALLPQMLAALEEGYDCCGARRVTRRGEPALRSGLSRLFYKIINLVTDMHLVQGGSDYRMMTREVVQAVISLQKHERFTKGIQSWVGFRTKIVLFSCCWILSQGVDLLVTTRKLCRFINGFLRV